MDGRRHFVHCHKNIHRGLKARIMLQGNKSRLQRSQTKRVLLGVPAVVPVHVRIHDDARNPTRDVQRHRQISFCVLWLTPGMTDTPQAILKLCRECCANPIQCPPLPHAGRIADISWHDRPHYHGKYKPNQQKADDSNNIMNNFHLVSGDCSPCFFFRSFQSKCALLNAP